MDNSLNTFEQLLNQMVEAQASDLHLTSDELPTVRVHGRLETLGEARLAAGQLHSMALALMQPRQREEYEQELTLDLAHALGADQRFRINVYRERGRTAMAVRRLENRFRTLDQWHLPEQLGRLAELRDGLVLVTGPTGSGKTTTLATLIHQINLDRACHIVTIEDPVEYIHQNHRSIVHQRELYADVPSFAQAVRASLREDPDVILVGEMRDKETMQAAITAAETGHLVFSTLHTGDAVGALDRMIGIFSGDEQQSIRQQLSMVLRAVIAQRLLPGRDGRSRVPAVEVLHVTTGVAHLIRTGKPQQIYSAIEAGSSLGMQTLEFALADLVTRGLVSLDEAQRYARDERAFAERLRLRSAPNSSNDPSARSDGYAWRSH